MRNVRGWMLAGTVVAVLGLPGCCSLLCTFPPQPEPGSGPGPAPTDAGVTAPAPAPTPTPSPVQVRGLVKVLRTTGGTTYFVGYQYQTGTAAWLVRPVLGLPYVNVAAGDYVTMQGQVNPPAPNDVHDGASLCKWANEIDAAHAPYVLFEIIPQTVSSQSDCPAPPSPQ